MDDLWFWWDVYGLWRPFVQAMVMFGVSLVVMDEGFRELALAWRVGRGG